MAGRSDQLSNHHLYQGQFRYLPSNDADEADERHRHKSRDRALGRDLNRKLRYVGGHMLPYIDLDVELNTREAQPPPSQGPSWRSDDVTSVVDRYLKAAEHHSAPGFTDTACHCCLDRNNENAERRFKQFIREGQGEREKSAETREAPLLDYGVGMYRSESPDLTQTADDEERKHPEDDGPFYVASPENTYSYKDFRDTTDPNSGRVAESVLDATSRYKRAMGQLNRTIEHFDIQ